MQVLTMEQYSAFKRKFYAVTLMNTEAKMLSVPQSQKNKYYMSTFICNAYRSQIHRDKEQNDGCPGGGWWREGVRVAV